MLRYFKSFRVLASILHRTAWARNLDNERSLEVDLLDVGRHEDLYEILVYKRRSLHVIVRDSQLSKKKNTRTLIKIAMVSYLQQIPFSIIPHHEHNALANHHAKRTIIQFVKYNAAPPKTQGKRPAIMSIHKSSLLRPVFIILRYFLFFYRRVRRIRQKEAENVYWLAAAASMRACSSLA